MFAAGLPPGWILLVARAIAQKPSPFIGQQTENGVVMPVIVPTVGRTGPMSIIFVVALRPTCHLCSERPQYEYDVFVKGV